MCYAQLVSRSPAPQVVAATVVVDPVPPVIVTEMPVEIQHVDFPVSVTDEPETTPLPIQTETSAEAEPSVTLDLPPTEPIEFDLPPAISEMAHLPLADACQAPDLDVAVEVTADIPLQELPVLTLITESETIDEPLPALEESIPVPFPVTGSETEQTLPDFLRYDAVRSYYRKHRVKKFFKPIKLSMILGWLVMCIILTVGYAGWRYAPKSSTYEQQAKAMAASLALAINERDYQTIYDNTMWIEHFKKVFQSSEDIKHFCQQTDKMNSLKLTNLAELWQMKHTVVVGGKRIGRNSIGYTFTETSGSRRSYRFTVTRTPSGRWFWDISYDYRLAPSDIPLLNNIVVRSRLHKAK